MPKRTRKRLSAKGGFGFSDIWGYLKRANEVLREKKYAGKFSKFVPEGASVWGVPVGKLLHGAAALGYGKKKGSRRRKAT